MHFMVGHGEIGTSGIDMSEWQEFQGVNEAYALELYEMYRRDPQSVDEATRAFFSQHPAPVGARPASPESAEGPGRPGPYDVNPRVIVGAVNLAQSIRRYGHLAATIDPLGSRPRGRSGAAAGNAWRDRGRSAVAAGVAGPTVRSPTARRRCGTSSSGCARSTARRPATTSRTSSCLRSDTGCATRSRPAATARRTIRSIRSRCSTG